MSAPEIEINLIGKVSHFFAVNRPLSTLLLLASLLLGLVAFFLTPKQYNPEIVRPAFAVHIVYEGATTAGAIDRVVYELVEKINTVIGVDDVYTEVHDGAQIDTTVIFAVGYDATKAKLDLLSQLQQHSYLARGNISPPQIMEINPETIPVLQVVFGSPVLSIVELRQQVNELSHQLEGVENVSEMQIYGGYQSSLVVEADPNLMTANHISYQSLTRTLQTSQARFVSTGFQTKAKQIEMVFDGISSTPESVGLLLIQDGVRVRDVAQVYTGVGGSRSYVLYQDEDTRGEVVLLSVAKVEGSSAPQVTGDFLIALDKKLQQPEFSDLEYKVVSDSGVTAKSEIFGLTKNLITSIVIVAMVLLLFLSTRAAVVVLIAIPVTLLIVFGIGLLFDQTINRITLFALILSLGLLVDSAIVVVENIYSHLKEHVGGATKARIIAGAVDEVGVGLLLSALTSVVVFLPMNFITGMMGPYMGPIAFFVPVALIVSLLVAIVITPFVASYILASDNELSRVTRVFSQQLQNLTLKYKQFLQSVLYNRRKQQNILRIAAGLFVVSLVLPAVGLVHFQMLPRADRDQFYVYIDLPVDTNIEETKRLTSVVADILTENQNVVNVQQFVATAPIVDFNGLFKGVQNRYQSYQATLRVNLIPHNERKLSSTAVVTTLREAITADYQSLATAVRFMEDPPGPPVRATLVAKVSANNQSEQTQSANDLREFISTVAGVVDTKVSDDEPVGRVSYELDQTATEALGVSPAAIKSVMSLLSGPQEVGEFLGTGITEYTPLVLQIPASYRVAPATIDTLTITNQAGEMVSLRSVLKLKHELRPSKISFESAQPVSYVTAEVQDRSVVYVVIEIIQRLISGDMADYKVTDWGLFGMSLQNPAGNIFTLDWGGEWEMTLENFRDLGIAMGAALLLVYGLLVAQYNRFDVPAYILVTVPLGLIGILWGFLLLDQGFGIYLTATALIGFIALIGLVVNNAIIFLEYVEQAQAKGLSYREALLAAGEARLRPILLTSLTTVLGSLTIANDPVWSGLAWAIVFGLSLSTILTLIIYPTLLIYFTGDKEVTTDLQN